MFHTQDAKRAAKIFAGYENVRSIHRLQLFARIAIVDAPAFLLSLVLSCHCAAQTTRLPPQPATIIPGAKLTVVYQDERYFEGPSWDPVTGKL